MVENREVSGAGRITARTILTSLVIVCYFAAPCFLSWNTLGTILPAAIDSADAEVFYAARTRAWVDGEANSEYAFFRQPEKAPPFHPFLGEILLAGLSVFSGGDVPLAFFLSDLLVPLFFFLVLRRHLSREFGEAVGTLAALAATLTPAILHGPNILRILLDRPLYLGLGGGLVLQRTTQPQSGLLLLAPWIAFLSAGFLRGASGGQRLLLIAQCLLALLPWTSFHVGTAAAAGACVLFLMLVLHNRPAAWIYLNASWPAIFSWIVFLVRYLVLYRSTDPAMLRTQHISTDLAPRLDSFDILELSFHLILYALVRKSVGSRLSLSIWLSLAIGCDLLKIQSYLTSLQIQPFHWRVYVGDLFDIILLCFALFSGSGMARVTEKKRQTLVRGAAVLCAFVVLLDAGLAQAKLCRESLSRWELTRDAANAAQRAAHLDAKGELLGHQATLGAAAVVTSMDVYFHEGATWGSLDPRRVFLRQDNYRALFPDESDTVQAGRKARDVFQKLTNERQVVWLLWGPEERRRAAFHPEDFPEWKERSRSGPFILFHREETGITP